MNKSLKPSVLLRVSFRVKRCAVAITLILFMSACSSTPEIEIPEEIAGLENLTVFDVSDEPTGSIEFEELSRIGDSEDLIIGRIGGIAVDDNENVFLVDMDEKAVHIFRPDGSFEKSIGRSGDGPGEFRNVIAPLIKDDFLYVFDISQMRISAFSLENYTFSYAFSLGGGNSDIEGFPTLYQPLSDGDYLIITSNTQREAGNLGIEMGSFRLNSDGRLVQKDLYDIIPPELFVLESGNSVMWTSFSFQRRPLFSYSSDDKLYYANSDRIFIKVYDTFGNMERAFYYRYKNIDLSKEEALSMIGDDTFRQEARNRTLPETLPALSKIVVDDQNRIWVQLMNYQDHPYDWWVLNSEGEKIAQFARPAFKELQVVKDNYAYFREADEETGLQEIVKYKIKL